MKVPLQELLEQRMDAGDRLLRHQIKSLDRAIVKSEAATDRRFSTGDAYREQLAAQAQSFMPRELAESQLAGLREQISDLQLARSEDLGKDESVRTQRARHEWSTGLIVASLVSALSLMVSVILAVKTLWP